MSFDVTVIGAGPAGYVFALKAAQLGLKVALVEKDATFGGTCLNVGCIPSKALLTSTEHFHFIAHSAAAHGIKVGKPEADIPALMARKAGVVSQLCKGIETLVAKRGITVFRGFGKITAPGSVEVKGEKTEAVATKKIVIATGSKPTELPFLKFDGSFVCSSDQGIAFEKVPENLVVIGGGAIGLELGSVWARLGSKVTVLEFLPNVAAFLDADVCRVAERALKKQGIDIRTETKVTGVIEKDGKRYVTAENKGKVLEFLADKVLVAVGRAARNEGLGLEELGVKMNNRRVIETDAHYQTSVPGIYAIGDTISGPMLAHKAEEEGVALAEHLAGKHGHVNYAVIPNVVYTEPELSSVGLTEAAAKEKGIAIKVGKFNLAANGRAIASDATDGLVKVIADAKTDRLLGVQIVAKGSSEMIAAACAHMEYGGSSEDVWRTCFAHPTISEAFKEAAMNVDKLGIHSV